jgi:hypothetical protein
MSSAVQPTTDRKQKLKKSAFAERSSYHEARGTPPHVALRIGIVAICELDDSSKEVIVNCRNQAITLIDPRTGAAAPQ